MHGILENLLQEERADWEKLFKERRARYDEKDWKSTEEPEFNVPENPEPLGIAVEGLVGRYFDEGYKEIRLEMKEG